MIGWFGEDVVDWVGDRVSDAGDVFLDIAKEIPFAPELAGAMKDLINGPFRDIAKTRYGGYVLRALSTTVYGPLAWTIGPQLASIAFAVPGLARGQEFWEAWFTEVNYRAEKSMEAVGGEMGELAADVNRVVQFLMRTPRHQWVELARAELALRLGVDEWTIQKAIEIVDGILPDPEDRQRFDPVTGKPTGVLGRRRLTGSDLSSPSELTACEAAAAYKGTSAAVREALRLKCIAERGTDTFANERTQQTSAIAKLFGTSSTSTAAPAPDVDRPRTGTAGNVALVGLIGAAGAALVWFYVGEKR